MKLIAYFRFVFAFEHNNNANWFQKKDLRQTMIKNGNKYTDPRSRDLQLILRKHGVFFITCIAKGLSISTDNYNNTQAEKL